jgi:GNAT superfamily N-acetyltransferase
MSAMPNTPQIKLATPEDAAELARLLTLFEAQTITLTQATARLAAAQSCETAYLAMLDGRAVGLACLQVTPTLSDEAPTAEITELFVEKEQQGNGIERLLLAQVETLARQRQATQITLLAGFKNTPTQEVYRAAGFRDYALAMRKYL